MHRALAEAIELFESGKDNCHRAEDRPLVDRYLAALAPVLADAVLGNDVLSKLPQVERLFGNTWLIDSKPFNDAFVKWRQFKDEYVQFAVRGMTVNERLYAMCFLEEYDQAVADKDAKTVREILTTALVDPESIDKIIKNIEGAA